MSRAWGRREDVEDETTTKDMTPEQILEYRSQKMAEQDGQLGHILSSVKRQKELGLAIGKETEDQLGLIGRLDEAVEKEDSRIKVTTERVEKLTVESSTKCLWITICVLILVLVVLVVLAVET
eukprot:TRINITY_DN13447_c0_g1_i1.p1 TRINITY_DN13447_c0_g1~~TRINITY_DN13447_c0_g1_i1.p1  ORF type:complete len:123 (+),score=24.97 TRINITY_DN13447_c0_g1_i1:166-534(+)